MQLPGLCYCEVKNKRYAEKKRLKGVGGTDHKLILLVQLPFCSWELQETSNYALVKRLRSAGGVEWRGVRDVGGWVGGNHNDVHLPSLLSGGWRWRD